MIVGRPAFRCGFRLQRDRETVASRGRSDGSGCAFDGWWTPEWPAAEQPGKRLENGGRRGIINPFGEVNWVRNLPAAGRATITVGRRTEKVITVELDQVDAAAFIRAVLAPHARRFDGTVRLRATGRLDELLVCRHLLADRALPCSISAFE